MKHNHFIAVLMIGCSTTLVCSLGAIAGGIGLVVAISILGLIVGVMEFAIFRFVSKEGYHDPLH